ncbi:cell filamentation protein Fic [Bradyrhizobium ottawaense]|uniref:mobile mystery protein B n=1 Tax=Bradyrhizobium TaxID=374 RepID=UPI000BE95F0E|nr:MULTISPECIES: mobile mystery protein B [Bradyrhizobium]PDT64390.1 cell filamentation protein Fic [Bradyrhizobium ottawaense]
MQQAHALSLGCTVVAVAADRGHHFSKPPQDRIVLVEGHGVEGDAHAGPEDLIPTHITLRSELNELEQQNIATANRWAFGRRKVATRESFLKSLHRRMFERVWRWAGKFRTTERNLGVAPHLIEVSLHQVLDDARYWVENNTYPPDELAARFHHRLVSVHPFPNGNGRWSRLAADVLIVQLGGQRFTWGGADLQTAGAARATYIAALQAADNHDLGPLIAFAQS